MYLCVRGISFVSVSTIIQNDFDILESVVFSVIHFISAYDAFLE
jgi:hypothetical protein